jgi:uncharacterized protein DUF4168
MRTSTLAIAMAAAALFVAAPVSFAQQAPEAPSARAPAAAVSDRDIETFASIYVDLLATATKFNAEMESAQTDEQAREIKARAQSESVAKVEQRGWTPEKFNSVSEAIDQDPALTEKAVRLIEAK